MPTIDIEAYPIAFGCWVFEPVTGAGRDWCAGVTADFWGGDPCMTGFHPDAFGVVGRQYRDVIDQIEAAGLVVREAVA